MIGIFGGTFDPIHYGHLRSALEIKELVNLDEIRLIPSAHPPHRKQPQATPQQRIDMLRLATLQHPELLIDTRELDRQGPSFMIDTLLSLRHDFPQRTLLLIIGSDAFSQLTRWHQWQRLFDIAHIVVMTRPNFSYPPLDDFFTARVTTDKQDLRLQSSGKLYFQSVTPLDISATKIRAMVATQGNPAYLLPDPVITYIHQHQLYQSSPLTPKLSGA